MSVTVFVNLFPFKHLLLNLRPRVLPVNAPWFDRFKCLAVFLCNHLPHSLPRIEYSPLADDDDVIDLFAPKMLNLHELTEMTLLCSTPLIPPSLPLQVAVCWQDDHSQRRPEARSLSGSVTQLENLASSIIHMSPVEGKGYYGIEH